eukprot:GILJ01019976.1.p2 GENE.GILJ01019976.1~~GILJ01019976.1.p2  ORF type:complete len:171 (+),score=11.39 GILJ01019976.1:1046-1558(+)
MDNNKNNQMFSDVAQYAVGLGIVGAFVGSIIGFFKSMNVPMTTEDPWRYIHPRPEYFRYANPELIEVVLEIQTYASANPHAFESLVMSIDSILLMFHSLHYRTDFIFQKSDIDTTRRRFHHASNHLESLRASVHQVQTTAADNTAFDSLVERCRDQLYKYLQDVQQFESL